MIKIEWLARQLHVSYYWMHKLICQGGLKGPLNFFNSPTAEDVEVGGTRKETKSIHSAEAMYNKTVMQPQPTL